eukprot:gene10031-7008_t
MQVRHFKTLSAGGEHLARTQAIAWSPNNKRLAIADATRTISLYDEKGERRDKFPAKASDKSGANSFYLTGLVFSPDSSKIAIAQSDNLVSIYRIGLEWGDKKAICNKFPQNSSVTCVTWPTTSSQGVELIAFGTMEGKVKVGILKSNKSQSLYANEHAVISISTNICGSAVVSGHLDGSVYVYYFETDEAGNEVSGSKKLLTHSCPPAVLSWGEHICAAGDDGLATFYNPNNGHRTQTFDYPVKSEGVFTCGAFNPSGQALVLAQKETLRFFDFNLRSRKWEEGCKLTVPNSFGFSALSWKSDGSRLITGSITGAVEMFDACLRRYRLRGAFEFTYVSHNQVIVKRLATGARTVLRSNMGDEVQRVTVHQDRYLVAHTTTTLLVGDLVSRMLSEVPWQLTGREKFDFSNPQVCMVFSAGELVLIEYGSSTLLGTCRTEERNSRRISVRIYDSSNVIKDDAQLIVNSENGLLTDTPANAKRVIAYLLDSMTIQVDDLVSGVCIGHIPHHVKVDWLDLDYRASKLLFRDKQHELFLYDLNTQQRTTLLNYCTFVSWVPQSNVVVAQNRVELCVWYNISAPDSVAIVPLKGEVESVERSTGKTEVIVDEGVNTVAYLLDEPLIELGVAMEEEAYDRACDLLDTIALTPKTEAIWRQLSAVAVQEMKLHIAQRCYAALGDVANVQAINRINKLAAKAMVESDGSTDGYDHYTVQAELFILKKDFKRAEQIYLESGKVEEAIAMWEELQRYEESMAVAASRELEDLPSRRARYYEWLMETRQFEKAGEAKEAESKYMDAINLYLRGGTPARAANVVTAYQLKPETQLLEAIAAALFKAQIFEKAGDFFQTLKMDERAIDAYKRGHIFSRAVEFARDKLPDRVQQLEEEWGDYLVSQNNVDHAINHYMEAGKISKAVKAALDSRQFTKAAQILENQTMEDDASMKTFYCQLARHYEEVHEYADAERNYIKGGAFDEAVEMYSRAGMADHMYRVAQRHLSQQQLVSLFVSQARQLEAKGDYAGAERIYLKVNEPDQAIVMYKRSRDFTNMIRLVQAYRPDYLLKTHLSLGAQFEKENNLKTAEAHFVEGKDWGRAVNMYRDRDMWDDAVRVAKVHGGANASKQVVLSRAVAIDAEDGVRLLVKFGLVESGIDSALEAQKFDLAMQWAQLAQPAKLPYVYLKYAMHYEDQGDFRMAEDAFLKSGKPREAIDMYIHQHDFSNAMRVAEAYDPSAIPIICSANGRVAFQQGNHKEAEALYLRANAPETLLKMYVDARMYKEAQRLAKEYCPEMQGDIAKRIAMQSNDPQVAGAVLEENGEYTMAVETYLNATGDHVKDENTLVSLWVRAVKLAHKHARTMLKEVLESAVTKLKELNRFVEAGKCMEDCENYKGAIHLYVTARKFDMAEDLAKRISPELEEYVKRAIVEDSIQAGSVKDPRVVEEMDPEAALKAYIATNDFTNALRMAKQRSPEEAQYVAALEMQFYARKGEVEKALEVVRTQSLDTDDFRFYDTWVEVAQKVIFMLPSDRLELSAFHTCFVKVVDSMRRSGQKQQDITRADGLLHVVHIYYMSRKMLTEYNLADFAFKLMLGLPRWIPFIPADKAFFDAGMAAKAHPKGADIAFCYLNRTLDILERMEDGDSDSSNIDNKDFAMTDFPRVFMLPTNSTIPGEEIETVKNWVLQVSIEQSGGDRELPLVDDPANPDTKMFEGALTSPAGSSFPECAVTGFPILPTSGGMAKCTVCKRTANQDDWYKLVMITKECPWCGVPQTVDYYTETKSKSTKKKEKKKRIKIDCSRRRLHRDVYNEIYNGCGQIRTGYALLLVPTVRIFIIFFFFCILLIDNNKQTTKKGF